MNSRHRKTLEAIFRKPTASNIVFADLESLFIALGGKIVEGRGSRAAFEFPGSDLARVFHRPHPGKEAKKYQVETFREWFEELGITP